MMTKAAKADLGENDGLIIRKRFPTSQHVTNTLITQLTAHECTRYYSGRKKSEVRSRHVDPEPLRPPRVAGNNE
jgi:hypothetical protein